MAAGELTALSPASLTITGEGAHKVCVSPDGKHVYVCNTVAKTVTVYEREAGGTLKLVETTTATATGEPTDIGITPDGTAVFVAQGTTGAIVCFTRNATTGALTKQEEKAVSGKARNLDIHPNGKWLYVTNEEGGKIHAFTIGASAKLTELGVAIAAGTKPRGISVSPDGKNVYVGNFGSANVTFAAINQSTGALETLAGSPIAAATGADITCCSPDGSHVYVSDFGVPGSEPGGTTIHQYKRGAEGKLEALTAASVTCGEGPTDLKVSPDGLTVTVCCFGNGATGKKVQVFSRPVSGELTALSSSATVKEMEGLCYSPDGKYVYAVAFWDQGAGAHGLIFQFWRTPATGKLTLLAPTTGFEIGEEPQHVAVHPTNKWVYFFNAKAGTISCYERKADGTLKAFATRDVVVAAGTYDGCISPDGKFLYVCNRDAVGAKAIAYFKINQSTGVLEAKTFVEAKEITGGAEGAEHAGGHSIVMTADGKAVYMCTQSKPGRIYQYERNTETGALKALSPEFVSTTRMIFAFRLTPESGNPYGYASLLGVLNTAEAGEVQAYKRGAGGKLEAVGTGVLTGGKAAGEVYVSPDGKNLYVTNKEPTSENPNKKGITTFSIDTSTGAVTKVGEPQQTGEEPRGVWCSPLGDNVYVCDQGGEFIHVFDRDPETGKLYLKEIASIGIPALCPSHAMVAPNGQSYYNCDKNNGEVSKGHLGSAWSRLGVAPVLTSPGNQETIKGGAVSLQVVASETGEYSASGLPAGLSIDPISGVISGTASGEVEEPTVTIKVKGTGGEVGSSFKWKIASTGAAPVVTKPSKQESNKGKAIPALTMVATNSPTGFTLTAVGGGANPVTGLSISAGGVITGTPSVAAGTYTVEVTASNGFGSGSTTFEWKINPVLALKAPSEQSNTSGVTITPFQIGAVTAGTGVAPYSYSIESGFPPGITVTSAGVAEGTPGGAEHEYTTAKLKVTDAEGITDKVTFTWKIAEALTPPAITNPPKIKTLHYYAYDFLTGEYIADVPMRGVQFTRTLDAAGTLSGSVNLYDPRIQASNILAATTPNKTLIVADWGGVPVWHGISQPRKWDVDSSGSATTGVLSLSYAGTWAYWQQRIQATDYSSPPYSGITGLGSTMGLWTQTPWFAPLIACQVMQDALLVPYGNPLGGTRVTLNGETPNAKFGLEVPEGDLIAVSYPYPSLQTVESIVSQLSQLGLGVGFDFAYEVGYAEGKPRGQLQGRFEVDWPWRGAPEDIDDRRPPWRIDLVRARKYSFPEDGSQTGWQIFEVGGGGAIYVESNIEPPTQGYPLLERIVSRSSIQSPQIMQLLALNGLSDLSLFSYAPVTPVVTLGLEDPMLPFGEYEVGDLVHLRLQPGDDPRFPDGMDGVWRLTSYTVDAKDEGDSTVQLTFAQPSLFVDEVNGPSI